MADFIKHNRTFAACALAVVIILSIFLGANRSVASLRSSVLKLYSGGADGYGVPEEDVLRMAGYAEQLYALADSHGCSDGGFEAALNELKDCARDPMKVGEALNKMYSSASVSYNKMNASGADETAKNSARSYFYEITSVKMRLANNEKYNSAAKKYNGALSAPLSILVIGSRSEAAVFG